MKNITMKPKAYLFDLDGVLIDSLKLSFEVVNVILARQFPGASVSKEFIKCSFGYAVPDFFRRILDEAGIDYSEGQWKTMCDDYERERENAAFDLLPGVEELLNRNESEGIRQALVSNNPLQRIIEIISKVGLQDYFEIIIGNDNPKAPNKKPAPDCYLLAAKELQVDVNECIVVEDSDIGVQAGKAAGMYVIGVATGGSSEDELRESGADVVVSTLQEIIK